jgi:hypothetical protein
MMHVNIKEKGLEAAKRLTGGHFPTMFFPHTSRTHPLEEAVHEKVPPSPVIQVTREGGDSLLLNHMLTPDLRPSHPPVESQMEAGDIPSPLNHLFVEENERVMERAIKRNDASLGPIVTGDKIHLQFVSL